MSGLLRRSHAEAICSACAAGVSILCMSSMAVALAGASATGAAAAVGMAGMESTSSGSISFWAALLSAVGLGGLASAPDAVLRTLLVISLTLSTISAYVIGRARRRRGAFLLVGGSAVAMYASIYLAMSEPLYTLTLVTFIAGALWTTLVGRRRTTSA